MGIDGNHLRLPQISSGCCFFIIPRLPSLFLLPPRCLLPQRLPLSLHIRFLEIIHILTIISYHGIEGNKYPLPNDEEEVRRLDDLHLMYRCHLGRNVLAPIRANPTTIIDLGTGSGLWPIEVATRYPDCAVTGVDLSPVNPLYEIPDNCDFIVADVNDGLTWPDGSIDLVHSR
jgi:hypothetical protein